jgi:predicted small lipoprotein YifL
MKKIFRFFAIACLSISLYSCGIKGHNRAELPSVNANDERIYGDIGGPAKQTKLTYPDDDGKQAERIMKIKQKMYPK